MRKILKIGKKLSKEAQKSLNGGARLTQETDCYSHFTFCNEAHPSSYDAFAECMDSCGRG